jgi:NTE family protein
MIKSFQSKQKIIKTDKADGFNSIGLASPAGIKRFGSRGALKFLEEKNIRPNRLPEQVQEQLWELMYAWKTPNEILEFLSLYIFSLDISLFRKAGFIDSDR